MGDEVKWTPANFAKNWMNICQGFQRLPFISQTLWQVGPMPWLMNWGSSSGWFGNANWGNIGDTVQLGNIPKKDKEEKVDDSNLTPEEKLAAREEKAKQKTEIRTLVNNYIKIYSLLEAYGKTLTDSTNPTKTEFEEILNLYKGKATNSMTKEQLEAEINNIMALYNKHKTEIQDAKLKEAREKITSASNTKYTDKVTKLNTALSNPTETFEILKKDSSGAIEWDNDVDIIELLSTWNSHGTTKTSHIMRSIADKYQSAIGENKSKYETLTNKLHDRLATEADNIQESKLSDETKKALEDAKTQLAKFDTMAKRFPAGETDAGKNYSNAFDNLYRAIRLAEAELAEKELKESFNFLGDDNPYKTTTIVTDTKTDLESEYLENARIVTDPNEAAAPEDEIIEEAPEAPASGTGTGTTVNILGTKYDEGVQLGITFKSFIKGGTRNSKARDILHNNFNKENIIGILDQFPYENQYSKGIIEDMGDSRFDTHNCNRVVKALMRKAAEIPEVKQSQEYKALVDYFDAKGNMAYNADSVTPNPELDTFEFTKNTDFKDYASKEKARKEIDSMIWALVQKIKDISEQVEV